MKKLFLLIPMTILLLASCQTKQSVIGDLRALSQELEMRGDNYTLNDWQRAGEDYYKINKRLSQRAGEFTDAEVQEIHELNGRCARSFTEGAITKVTGAVNAIKSFLNGFRGK